jgi:hypothetical protein
MIDMHDATMIHTVNVPFIGSLNWHENFPSHAIYAKTAAAAATNDNFFQRTFAPVYHYNRISFNQKVPRPGAGSCTASQPCMTGTEINYESFNRKINGRKLKTNHRNFTSTNQLIHYLAAR